MPLAKEKTNDKMNNNIFNEPNIFNGRFFERSSKQNFSGLFFL